MKFKKYFFLIIVFVTSTNLVFSAEKTAFLDIDYILNNSNLGKSIYVELNKINKQNIDNLNKIEKVLKNKKEAIDKTKNIATKEKLDGDIKLFTLDISIKINPTNNDKIYAPESPRIIWPNTLNSKIIISNENKLVTKYWSMFTSKKNKINPKIII